MSQDELGKRVEVHGAVIGRYERDEVKPSIEMAKTLAEVLEVSLDYLVGSTDTLLDNAVVKKILDKLDIQKLKANEFSYSLSWAQPKFNTYNVATLSLTTLISRLLKFLIIESPRSNKSKTPLRSFIKTTDL